MDLTMLYGHGSLLAEFGIVESNATIQTNELAKSSTDRAKIIANVMHDDYATEDKSTKQ